MLLRPNKTRRIELKTDSPQRDRTQTAQARFKRVQSYFGWAAVLIPTLGLLVTVALIPTIGIDLIAVYLLVGMYVLTTLGLEVGFHRHFSHCAFQTTTAMRVALAIFGSMAGMGHVIHWVSHHRGHHQGSDRPVDPHSPHINAEGKKLEGLGGLWHAHIGWFFKSEFPNVLLTKDLLRDPVMVKVNQLYLFWVFLGFAIPAALGGILIGTWSGVLQGLLWGGFVRVFLAHHAFWGINSICHVYGSRPFVTGDRSTNNLWLAIPTMGESWHNNHHAFSNSAIVGLNWWQIDPSAWVIRALAVVGLVWDVKAPSTAAIESKRVK
ncbi:acyl-CoA desaturase [Pleurocapsales cyanobacterium LEGE 10410]|nr:acyl-CoA desaturase [Pleurocapsales cyanobacterium LEGE 10410]